MKVLICGKGGSGKSTVTALLAKALNRSGKKVLVVDADESNLCLHRLLGAHFPEILMDAMGGRKGVKAQLTPETADEMENTLLKNPMTMADIPEGCLADADGVKLLVVGKISSFGEGCACMIGNISKTILSRLQETANEVVLIDAEAGLEHFGRRVDAGCDLSVCVVDPTYESFALAGKVKEMADMAGIQVVYVLNKVDESVRDAVTGRLVADKVIATLPKSDELFLQSLEGEALNAEMVEIDNICRFLEGFTKPVTLATL